MDSIILVAGKWRFEQKRWDFEVDAGRGAKIMQVCEEVRFDSFLRMLLEDFCLDQRICNVKLSYVPAELMNGMPQDTPPIVVSNERQLRGYLQLCRKSAIRLCVEISSRSIFPTVEEGCKDESKCGASFNKGGQSTFSRQSSTSGGGVRQTLKRESSQEEHADVDEDGLLNFDCFDDEDGASSGDDEFVSRFRKIKKEDGGSKNSESIFNHKYYDMERFAIAVGQRFPSKTDLEYRLKVLAVIHRFDFDIVKSNKSIYVAKCWLSPCKWYVRAARPDGGNPCFYIRKFIGEHTCSVTERSTRSRRATPAILGRMYLNYCGGVGKHITAYQVSDSMRIRFGVKVPEYWKWNRALKIAKEIVTGTAVDSYRDLPSYLFRLREANPGSHIKMEVDGLNRFKCLFFAFDACIRGFPFIRKVVVVDGTHLRGHYKGTLLTASMQDGNFNIFPVAYGVVDGETDVAWEWFFRQLNVVLPDDPDLAIISDRHPSISNAIRCVFPRAGRGVCTYHMRKNIITRFKGEGFKLFKQAATAFRIEQYNYILHKIKTLDSRLFEYLEKADPRLWSRVHFPGNRYNLTTSNIAESVNNAIDEARDFPIVHLIDAIRAMLTRWFAKRKATALATTTMLTPRIEKTLKERFAAATKYTAQSLDENRAVVKATGSDYVVDIRGKTCTCNRFQIFKIPCVHAVAAAVQLGKRVIDLTHPYYYTSYWYHAYQRCVMPIDAALAVPEEVAGQVCKPPVVRVQTGRPRKKRYRDWLETGLEKKAKLHRKMTTCSRCGNVGHNVRSCKVAVKVSQDS